MKILINDNLFSWNMTGLLGKGARWFFGFSRMIPGRAPTPIRELFSDTETMYTVPDTGESGVVKLRPDRSGILQYRTDSRDGFQKIYFGNFDVLYDAVVSAEAKYRKPDQPSQ